MIREVQTCGEGQQRLAGAGLADEGDDADRRIHQQLERHALLNVACLDAVDGVDREVDFCERAIRKNAGDGLHLGVLVGCQVKEHVGVTLGGQG